MTEFKLRRTFKDVKTFVSGKNKIENNRIEKKGGYGSFPECCRLFSILKLIVVGCDLTSFIDEYYTSPSCDNGSDRLMLLQQYIKSHLFFFFFESICIDLNRKGKMESFVPQRKYFKSKIGLVVLKVGHCEFYWGRVGRFENYLQSFCFNQKFCMKG